MPLPLLAAGLAAIPSIFGAIRGIGQRRQAKRIRANAIDPGYEMNSGVLQNADILQNRYNNYSLPGYSMQMNNLGTNAATAFNNGAQGASSGGDVLDLATKIAYGTGQQQNQLMLQNAQGKEAALGGFLNANAAAGQESQNANAYDRQRYQDQLAEAAALYGASDQNINNAGIGLGSIGTTLAMNGQVNQGTQTGAYPVSYAQNSPFQQSVSQRLTPDAMRRFLPLAKTTSYQSMPNLKPIIPFPR